jgi:glycosyltransferase involved in cell wall biosynthesis
MSIKNKRKLLQINSVVNYGSTGRIAEGIGKLAIENNWDSYIAFSRHEQESESKRIWIGNSLDVVFHGIQTRLFDRHGLASRRATKQLIDKIKCINPDVIQLHNLHGYYINIELLFQYLASSDIPVVWTLHDCWPITGHCVHFDFINCEKWKTECHNCPQIHSYPASFFVDQSTKNYQIKKELFNSLDRLTIVPVSNWLATMVGQSFLSKYSAKVINNGIDVTIFKPVASNFRVRHQLENKFLLLGVALGFGERKGYQYFIELSKQLKSDELIVLVGVSQEQVNSLPVGIIGITKTNNTKELAEIYSAADVFINPTLEDNFPTTNIEALACGIPVITFNTGGSPECLDENCGLVVDRGDIQGLITAIATVKKNSKNYYTEYCQKRAKSFFDRNNKFSEYIDLYSHLIRD